MVRAIARAESLVHEDAPAAVDAILRALPQDDRAHVERLVSLYAPAVPATPLPSAHVLARELALYPELGAKPDVGEPELARVVDPRFASALPPGVSARGVVRARGGAILAALVALALAAAAMWAAKRRALPADRR